MAGAAVSIAVSALVLFGKPAAAAVGTPVDAGAVVLMDPTDGSKALTSGGSATEFTLRLPDDASCPGDSANDQWRVQSFLVPAADDPGALHYGQVGPDGDGHWPLYDMATNAFVHILTLANSQAGLPGKIDAMPTFSFVLFPPGTLPDGRYRLGVACTFFRETSRFWDAELVLRTSANDSPGKLVWRVADAPGGSASAASGSTANGSGTSVARWAAAVTGVLLAALAIVFWQHSRRARPLLKEHP